MLFSSGLGGVTQFFVVGSAEFVLGPQDLGNKLQTGRFISEKNTTVHNWRQIHIQPILNVLSIQKGRFGEDTM